MICFNDFIFMNRIKFVYKLFKKSPDFISKNYSYFMLSSKFLDKTDDLMKCEYGVEDFLSNDLDALVSRILYVHDFYTFKWF